MSRPVRAVRKAFSRPDLKRVCEATEESFSGAYGMDTVIVPQHAPADFYHFKDNGSNVLAVAHLDTVQPHHKRGCHFLDTAGGPVVYSGALDDRLGAYIILELLPQLGIVHDVLLTTGEESGQSTAQYFEPAKDYDWIIEFDRGGTDVVMYQYEDRDTADLVRDSGARVGEGIFSDICYLEHLEVKAFNWGVGYRDYHGPRAHAYLDDTYDMVAKYVKFHRANDGVYMPHEEEVTSWQSLGRSRDVPWWLTGAESMDDDIDAELLDDPDFTEYPTLDEIRRALDAMEA